jgi:hypothetical protein
MNDVVVVATTAEQARNESVKSKFRQLKKIVGVRKASDGEGSVFIHDLSPLRHNDSSCYSRLESGRATPSPLSRVPSSTGADTARRTCHFKNFS